MDLLLGSRLLQSYGGNYDRFGHFFRVTENKSNKGRSPGNTRNRKVALYYGFSSNKKDSRDYVLKKKAFNELWSEEGTVSFFIISRVYLS